MPGAMAHLGECRRGRCPPLPRTSPHCTPAPRSSFPAADWPSPWASFSHDSNSMCVITPPVHRPACLHISAAPRGGISGPPVPSPHSLGCSWLRLWTRPSQTLLPVTASRGPSPFQAASLWCLWRPLLVVPRHCTVLSTT